MKDYTGCKRQFSQLSRAWYGKILLHAEDILDEITMGFYPEDGGTLGEFVLRWIDLAGTKTPMLCSFDDSWDALWGFRDVLEKMAAMDGTNPTPKEICKMLISCGVEDDTHEISPYPDLKIKEKESRLYLKPDSIKDSWMLIRGK